MGELLNNAHRLSAEERVRRDAAEIEQRQLAAQHEAERIVAAGRAREFADIMREHNVPQLELVKGEEHVAYGWYAISEFEPLYDQSGSLFVSNDGTLTTFCALRAHDGKVQDYGLVHGGKVWADRVLSTETSIDTLARTLMQHGIV